MPWGERVVKVNKKVFVFLGRDMDPHFGFSLKLPTSKQAALALPLSEPTGYGLGKSGWVSVRLEAGAKVSFEQLRAWVLESYCAVAPKTLAARVRADSPASARPKLTRKSKVTAAPESKAEPKRAGVKAGKVQRRKSAPAAQKR